MLSLTLPSTRECAFHTLTLAQWYTAAVSSPKEKGGVAMSPAGAGAGEGWDLGRREPPAGKVGGSGGAEPSVQGLGSLAFSGKSQPGKDVNGGREGQR